MRFLTNIKVLISLVWLFLFFPCENNQIIDFTNNLYKSYIYLTHFCNNINRYWYQNYFKIEQSVLRIDLLLDINPGIVAFSAFRQRILSLIAYRFLQSIATDQTICEFVNEFKENAIYS